MVFARRGKRWTELASDKNKWQVIIQRTKGWREREKEAAEAKAEAARVRARATRSRGARVGGGRYAAAAPPPAANNSRGARAAARDYARAQAFHQQGGHWN